MANKTDFSTEEWALLREAPPLAGLRVAVADSGGDYREVASIAEAYGDAHESWWGPHNATRHVDLIDELLDAGPAFNRSRFGSAPDDLRIDVVTETATGCLRDAVALLERKATAEETDEYGQFVLAMAQRVAEAHKEGAVFGIGGQRVSDKERAALNEIADVLPSGSTAARG